MKKYLAVLTLFSVLFATGCADETVQTPPQNTNSQQNPLKAVTSFYPIYEIIREVGGKNVTVTNLVPAGAEPHDYEPTPKEIIRMSEANLVVYNGAGLEPWADKIIAEIQKNSVQTINLSELFANAVIKNAPQQPDEEEYLPYDPHFWMDPINYAKEVEAISQKLIALDPANKSDYEQNTQKFLAQLQDLNLTYENGFKSCKLNEFVTNHAAFAYLANRYHLTMIPISGLSPDAEPSPKTMVELVDTIKKKNIHYILTESLVSPKIADILAAETGAKTLVLNPLEGLTDEEIAQGRNYVSVMKDNLKNLQTALECQ